MYNGVDVERGIFLGTWKIKETEGTNLRKNYVRGPSEIERGKREEEKNYVKARQNCSAQENCPIDCWISTKFYHLPRKLSLSM